MSRKTFCKAETSLLNVFHFRSPAFSLLLLLSLVSNMGITVSFLLLTVPNAALRGVWCCLSYFPLQAVTALASTAGEETLLSCPVFTLLLFDSCETDCLCPGGQSRSSSAQLMVYTCRPPPPSQAFLRWRVDSSPSPWLLLPQLCSSSSCCPLVPVFVV